VAHPIRVAATVLALVVAVLAMGTGTALAVTRLNSATPALIPELTSTTATLAVGPRGAAAVPLPRDGSMAVAAVLDGTATALASADAEAVRPIASVAKAMTALVILETHPLVSGQKGPLLTITTQDVEDYLSIAASGGSYARVVLGEQLTEWDLLIGLMLPSANNFALTAARWVDGSVPAFVDRLNRRAAALGMSHTHFADPDGLDSATTSTAADLVLLAEAVVKNDSLLSVVSTTTAALPDGSTVANLNILLSVDPGWVGIKTGWTPSAGGCLLFAARRTLSGRSPPLTMVGAVLAQGYDAATDAEHPELGGAFAVARSTVDLAYAGVSTVEVAPASLPVSGRVAGAWGAYAALRVTGAPRYVLLRSGDRLSMTATPAPVSVPAAAGTVAGSVTISVGGSPLASWRLSTATALPAPSAWWKLLDG
jgi:D-alanyl-D-alanine carboxypeptidase (penicillin-binding protein 5/6)